MRSDANPSNFVTAQAKGWPRQETEPQGFVAPQTGPRYEKDRESRFKAVFSILAKFSSVYTTRTPFS